MGNPSPERQRELRAAAKAKGLCGQCKKRPAEPEHATCTECLNRSTPGRDGSGRGNYERREWKGSPPAAGQRCAAPRCKSKPLFAEISFCEAHGVEYVRNLRRL